MNKFSLLALLLLFIGASLQAQTALDKGNAAYGARNFKEAAFHFGRAEMNNPGNLDLQIKLANCYRFLNKMNEAEKRYARVCKNTTTDALNYFHYGQILQANRKYKEAIVQFDKYASSNKTRGEQARKACLFAQRQATTPSAFTVAKENSINHVSFDDYAPVLHKNKLLFTSARKINIGAGTSNEGSNYIYEVTRGATGQLSAPKLVKKPIDITPQGNLTPFTINSTETLAATTYNQFTNGVRHIYKASFVNMSMELSSAKHGMKELTYIPSGEPFPHVGDMNSASFPSFSNNGQTIYFSAYNFPGGFGGFDIWVMYKQGNTWTKPQNLGPNVNSVGDEICPVVASNGQLFFSSDYHKGFGGFDIYRASNQGGVWKNVRNLGNKVNSSSDDQYFTYDPVKRIGYFSSNKDGFYNIYSARLTGTESAMPLVNESERAVAVVTPITTPKNTGSNNVTTSTVKKTAINPKKIDINNSGSTNNPYSNNNNSYTNKTNNNQYVAPNLNNTNNTNNTGLVKRTPSGGYRPMVNNTPAPNNNTATYYYPPANTNTNTNTNTVAPTAIGDKPTIDPDAPNLVPCAMNFYIGAVIDKETQRPIKGASIYIKNTKTNEEKRIKEPTNHYGEYSVILEPLHDYTIAISKPGYRNLVFDINTGSGGKKTLLGTRQLLVSPTVGRDKYGSAVEDNAPVVIANKPTTDQLVNPVRPTGKYFSYDANGMEMPDKGYLIQTIVTDKLTKEQIDYLGQYGNVITENRGKDKAYRIGIFASPIHTEQALASIKQKYPDAFKVPVELDNKQLGNRIALSSQVIYPLPPPKPASLIAYSEEPTTSPQPTTPVTTTTTPPPIKETPVSNWTNNSTPVHKNTAQSVTKPTTSGVAFKVQLGAFKNPKSINFPQLEGMGYIEQQKKANGLIYVYLSSFKTIEDARIARTKVKENGVAAPFIVAFKNGVQVNISDVVN